MKYRLKLGLLDNYVAIYKVLYNCKQILIGLNKDPNKNINLILKIQKMCDQTLDLKTKYEKAFEKLNMIDPSFLLLKKQLNECKEYITTSTRTLKELLDSITIIENDYLKLRL